MVIVLDIDGVICHETKPYFKAEAVDGAVEVITHWRDCLGYKVVLHTSRRERDRALTLKWLRQNKIPFDRLVMGKPKGDVYIDDKGFRFDCWEQFK